MKLNVTSDIMRLISDLGLLKSKLKLYDGFYFILIHFNGYCI